MPIVPLYGHAPLKDRLAKSFRGGRLPSSLLLHGPARIGKQRLALWLAGLLFCDGEDKPCGTCQHCRYMANLQHPDLRWLFPRPHAKGGEPDAEEIREDYREAIADRVEAGGLYAAPSGSEGIFISTVNTLTRDAAMSPAMARRKVFVIGDAERMVPQEGSEFAANAFLKLLEEPPADTMIVLTSSEPASLLPTIRSRVSAVRVPRLTESEVGSFLADSIVADHLKRRKRSAPRTDSFEGAPGRLFDEADNSQAVAAARRMLEASLARSPDIYSMALTRGVANARGAFTDSLNSLTSLLSERSRDAVARGDLAGARRFAVASDAVEIAKEQAWGNVNPQLITGRLLRELRDQLT